MKPALVTTPVLGPGEAQRRRCRDVLLGISKAAVVDAGHCERAFALITEAMANGVPQLRVGAWLLNESGRELVCVDLHRSDDGSHQRGATIAVEALAGYLTALGSERASAVIDADTDPLLEAWRAGHPSAEKVRSTIEAPIRRGGVLVGVLRGEAFGALRVFSEDELDFAASLAEVAARAVSAVQERAAMYALHATQAELEGHASELEKLVEQRTRSLRMVFDSSGDAMLTCDHDGHILGDVSREAEQWFGSTKRFGGKVWDYLLVDPATRAVFASGFEQLAADILPIGVCLDQLPRRYCRDGRNYTIDYRSVEDDRRPTLLLIVRDVTAEEAIEAAEEEARELQAVVANVLQDRAAFGAFCRECEAVFVGISTTTDPIECARLLHTLKGNAAVFGVYSVAAVCHEIEDELADAPGILDPSQFARLDASWSHAMMRLGAFILVDEVPAIEISSEDYETLVGAIQRGSEQESLLPLVSSWRDAPTRRFLTKLAAQVDRLARKLGKPAKVVIDDSGGRVPAGTLNDFFTAMVHVVRNAVDHGLESPDVRRAAGKDPTSTVHIRCTLGRDRLVVSVEDDGRGIDWERVRDRALACGLPADSRPELARALFTDGLSTRDRIDLVSGRGVGMGAVEHATNALGGEITLSSEPGRGTQWTFAFPFPLREQGRRPPSQEEQA